MLERTCDGCGKRLAPGELRYSVSIDVRAAYDTLEVRLIDLIRDHRAELTALIEKLRDADAERLESQIHKQIQCDLCPSCQARYILDPLRFGARDATPPAPPPDVDAFLRSLGYGEADGGAKDGR